MPHCFKTVGRYIPSRTSVFVFRAMSYTCTCLAEFDDKFSMIPCRLTRLCRLTKNALFSWSVFRLHRFTSCSLRHSLQNSAYWGTLLTSSTVSLLSILLEFELRLSEIWYGMRALLVIVYRYLTVIHWLYYKDVTFYDLQGTCICMSITWPELHSHTAYQRTIHSNIKF